MTQSRQAEKITGDETLTHTSFQRLNRDLEEAAEKWKKTRRNKKQHQTVQMRLFRVRR